MYIQNAPKRINVKGYKGNDCTINALGNAVGLSYDLSRKILQTASFSIGDRPSFLTKKPKTKDMFTRRGHVKNICNGLSVSKEELIDSANILTHRKKGNPQGVTLKQFASTHARGVYIVLVKGHLTTVIDGKIIDTWNSGSRIVEIAYEIDVAKAQDKIKSIAEFYKMDSDEHILKDHTGKILRSQAA